MRTENGRSGFRRNSSINGAIRFFHTRNNELSASKFMGMPEGKLRLSRSQQERCFFNTAVTFWLSEAFARNGRWRSQQYREELRSINVKALPVRLNPVLTAQFSVRLGLPSEDIQSAPCCRFPGTLSAANYVEKREVLGLESR